MSVQEQTIHSVTVTERTEVLHKGSGVVEKINREVLFDAKVSAVTDDSAKQKAFDSIKAGGRELDYDKLETTCKPF